MSWFGLHSVLSELEFNRVLLAELKVALLLEFMPMLLRLLEFKLGSLSWRDMLAAISLMLSSKTCSRTALAYRSSPSWGNRGQWELSYLVRVVDVSNKIIDSGYNVQILFQMILLHRLLLDHASTGQINVFHLKFHYKLVLHCLQVLLANGRIARKIKKSKLYASKIKPSWMQGVLTVWWSWLVCWRFRYVFCS